MTDSPVRVQRDADDGWQDIATAPKDGTVIELTWFENGHAQEIWPMQWGHIQKNGLFPGKVGMWVMPNGGATWNDDDPDGAPTHWRPANAPLCEPTDRRES